MKKKKTKQNTWKNYDQTKLIIDHTHFAASDKKL